MKVAIDNWRWQGVPFYLRAGKGLSARRTEVAIHFKTIPLCLFGTPEVCQKIDPNVLTLRLQPDEGIALRFSSKVPGEDVTVGNVLMDFRYEGTFKKASGGAYERLLLDGLRGDATLFARRDSDERAWEIVAPLLEAWDAAKDKVPSYPQGSDGPEEAAKLLSIDSQRWTSLK